ncbi:MAG: B12-binding domain-containing radical SAM protein [Planctomycetes bacterium]|nr:B12-binding domain-containing radical SAM protein [Planctomycetota bacterium]
MTRALDAGIIDSVLSTEPDLVGITMPFQEQIIEGLRIAARIRRARPDTRIAIGGPQVTKYEKQLFADPTLFDFIDFAVVGEGGAAVVELAEALQGRRAFGDVRSLYWRRNGGVAFSGRGAAASMDLLPGPSYDGANFDSHFKPEPLFGLMTSRGCAYNRCAFCSEAFHSNFDMRSPKRVFADVKRLVERNGARHVFFWDSLLPPRTMWELADMIAAEGLDVSWFANTKFYDLFARPDQVKRLYDGGLRALHFGMESANQRVLDLMRKGTRIDRVPAMLRALHDGGILAQVSWFAGFPTETLEEHQDTVRFLERHRETIDLDVFVGSFYFEFGTYVAAHPEEFDAEIVDIGGDFALRCRSGMSPEEVERIKAHYMQATDMDLLCHGGYFLYHVNRGLRPRLISRNHGERAAPAL